MEKSQHKSFQARKQSLQTQFPFPHERIPGWLKRQNPVVVSLSIPILIAFLFAAIWGQTGGTLGWLVSLVASPLIFLALANTTKGKWKRYGIAAALSITSFFTTLVTAAISQATVHKILASAAENAFISYYSPTVGARSRKYANKVIAIIATNSNADSLQKDVDFLSSYDQSKWLSKNQIDGLKKKSELLLAIRNQREADNKLLAQVQEALNTPIKLDTYKGIVDAATGAPKNPRFIIVVPAPVRQRLQQRLLDAQNQGQSLELAKKKADEEKARQADYESYLAAVTEVRKNVTRSVVQEMDSKGITYDSESDPVRLQIIQQIESEMKPQIYDSAPKTLTPAQIDSVWQEIQAQIRANL